MKCAGVGAAEFSKNAYVGCESVQSNNLLCAECAGVPKLPAHKYSGKYHKIAQNEYHLIVLAVLRSALAFVAIPKNCNGISGMAEKMPRPGRDYGKAYLSYNTY